MKQVIIAVFVLLIYTSCNTKQDGAADAPTVAATPDSVKFYPVKDYLSSQIQELNTTPYFIYKITMESGKKDSTVLSNKNDLKYWTDKFLAFDISDPSVKKYYKEEIFNDATLGTLTVTYTAVKTDLPVQTVHVLLDGEANKVKHIFINTKTVSDDSTVIEKLGWNARKSCFVNRIVLAKNASEKTQQNNIIWN